MTQFQMSTCPFTLFSISFIHFMHFFIKYGYDPKMMFTSEKLMRHLYLVRQRTAWSVVIRKGTEAWGDTSATCSRIDS